MQLHHLRTGNFMKACKSGCKLFSEENKVPRYTVCHSKGGRVRHIWNKVKQNETVCQLHKNSPKKTTWCTFNFSGLFGLTRLKWMNMRSQSETWQIDTGTHSPVSLGNLWGLWSARRLTRLLHVKLCERWSSGRLTACSRSLTPFFSHDTGNLRQRYVQHRSCLR